MLRWVPDDTCFDLVLSCSPLGAGFHKGPNGHDRVTMCPDRPTLDNLPRLWTSAHGSHPRLPKALGTCSQWVFSALLKTFIRKSALGTCLVVQQLRICLPMQGCACMLSHSSHVWLCVTLWTVAHHAPLSMGFSRQVYWSGVPFSPPGDLPDPGIEPVSYASCIGSQVLYH